MRLPLFRLMGYLNTRLMKLQNNPYVAGHAAPFIPYGDMDSSFCVANTAVPSHPSNQFALPPHSLWNDKSHTEQQYLTLGAQHVATMRRIITESNVDLAQSRRILDLGSGSGRLIRHLSDLAPHAQIWGVDISTEHVLWCQQHLSPPFSFAVTTIYPHLPLKTNHLI